MHSLAAGITVDLSGLQPQRPLSVALPVPHSLPAGVSPQALFVAAVESPGGDPRLLATRYDGADHMLIAQASRLSSFYPVWLDGQAVVQWLASTMVQVLQIRVPRPACADQPFALPDGSTVKFTSGPWSAGSDPLLWGCLASSNSEPGDVVAALTDNRPMGYSVQIAPGASVVRDPPTLDSSTARLLFDIASAGNARNLELLTAASTIRISVPAGGLPSAGAPVIVAAVRANMAVVAASAAQSAFLILEGLLQVIAAPESAALNTALDASGNIDCITAAVTTPGPVGLDQVLGGTQLGLRCLGSVLKGGATGVALTVLAAVTSFIATFTGALNLVLSQLTGTDTFTVALQRSPATSIAQGQTPPCTSAALSSALKAANVPLVLPENWVVQNHACQSGYALAELGGIGYPVDAIFKQQGTSWTFVYVLGEFNSCSTEQNGSIIHGCNGGPSQALLQSLMHKVSTSSS